MGSADTANDTPRARVVVAGRELLLALGVLGIGAFITVAWIQSPEGHTVRRLATGIAALVVGVVVVYLAFGRACSACGHRLRMFTFRTAVGSMPAIEHALTTGDAVGAARLLGDALGATTPGQGGASCSLSYCDGCRGLLSMEIRSGDEGRRTRVIRGKLATAVVPTIEAATAGRGAA